MGSIRSPAGLSPSFTPRRELSFTPPHYIDGGLSPIQKTPIVYGGGGQTPHTPRYSLNNLNSSMLSPNPLGSAYQRDRYGDGRFSGLRNMGSSSSPSYSEKMLSQSPNYSPLSSHQSSPSYSPRGDSNRQ